MSALTVRLHVALAALGLLGGAPTAAALQLSRTLPRNAVIEVEGKWEHTMWPWGSTRELARVDGLGAQDSRPVAFLRRVDGVRVTSAESYHSARASKSPLFHFVRRPVTVWRNVWNRLHLAHTADAAFYKITSPGKQHADRTLFEVEMQSGF